MTRSISLSVALLAALFLSACAEEQVAAPERLPRPVKTLVVAAADATGIRTFPARIEAAQRAELAFRVPGTVQEIPVKAGDRVSEGDLVARVDPTDYQIVVNDRQASFDRATKNFQRGKELVDSGAISRVDFDRLEAEFKSAQAALETAQQNLSHTELKAPFDGLIARRLVEQFEEVQAKQAVLQMQNIAELEVKFDVPESVIRGIRATAAERDDTERVRARSGVSVMATFVDQPGREFPLVFKEIATKADEQTQTFEVTYLMKQWDSGVVLPGMTASVTVDFSEVMDTAQVFTLPVAAVVGDYKLDPQVWVVDEQTMTVAPRSVKVGKVLDRRIEVFEGVEPGARIVTAGTPFLAEGMQVTLMAEREQAAPRSEDLRYQH